MNVQNREDFVTSLSYPGQFSYELAKRAMDLALAGLGLIVMALVTPVIWLLMRLEGGGPLFFNQPRRGARGKIFILHKFRTMVADAEEKRAALWHLKDDVGPAFKMRNDPRVTRVGRVVRRLSLDELPQVINVLKGEMSIVGPRPMPLDEADMSDPRQMVRLSVPPGLTCYWQIRGRSEVSFDERMRMDQEYVLRRSLQEDLRIVVKTFGAVVRGKGAY